MEGLTIREANEQDMSTLFQAYMDLEKAYGISAPDEKDMFRRWTAVMTDSRQTVLVAECGMQFAGTLTIVVVPNMGHGGQPWAALDNVVVEPSVRGKGIGTALLDRAAAIARGQHCYKIVLSSNLVRTKAHEFYRRLGWKQTHLGFSLDLE